MIFVEKEKVQHHMYYVSQILTGVRERYPMLDKLAFALKMERNKLRHYLDSHTIVILTFHPLKSVLKRSKIVGRLAQIIIELGENDIKFMP